MTFTVPVEKEVTIIDKNGEEITKYISYILQFIDRARFTASSLSLCCNKSYERKFDEKFILLLRKGVYSYECKDDWEKFNETSLPEKEGFYSHLNMENITDADYAHIKRVCKGFNIKNLGEYNDLYVQSDTLLLADIFENFRKMCIEICKLDPAKFLSAPRLAWQAALKKTEVKLDFLTDINMLLMVEKGIRGAICNSIY